MTNTNLFHVHTFRCGHAENVPDTAYIERAIELGASDIWFSDHAPFPGDPFRNRMKYDDLHEYLDTLLSLQEKYANRIQIHIGLEIEYLPRFAKMGYYQLLTQLPDPIFLLLGQHMAEADASPDGYSFSMDKEWRKENEYKALGSAIVSGIQSGYFDFVAHPDRIFYRCHTWTEDMERVAKEIILAAEQMEIPLEQNESSRKHKHQYWQEFWDLAEGHVQIVHGLDAHAVKELRIV